MRNCEGHKFDALLMGFWGRERSNTKLVTFVPLSCDVGMMDKIDPVQIDFYKAMQHIIDTLKTGRATI